MNLIPFDAHIENKTIFRRATKAHQALAELKGVAASIPDQNILINTLSLQEAKDSSAIENIITTNDELFLSDSIARHFVTTSAKEVHNYATALRNGFEQVRRTGLLTNNDILTIQACIEENSAGYRKLPGTELKNDLTGETVYTPPQHPDEIIKLMDNLERFINDDSISDWDPLVKMAVIHHQFESIHPFYDGNGRTGRIINILYLVQQRLLDIPVLYLSRYINQNKADYYRLLQAVRIEGVWQDWLLFMLDGVEVTSRQTINLINGIRAAMQEYKHQIREQLPSVYSQDLINHLFRHPYTKIEFVMEELRVHPRTAYRRLNAVVGIGLITKHKIGRDNYYLNDALFELLVGVGETQSIDYGSRGLAAITSAKFD